MHILSEGAYTRSAESRRTYDPTAFSYFGIDKLVLLSHEAIEQAHYEDTKANRLDAFRAVNVAQAAMIASGLVELSGTGEVEGVARHYQEFVDYHELESAARNLLPESENPAVGESSWDLLDRHFRQGS